MIVGVIGAGTMGSGIAQAFAQTEGYEVCLCDINEEFAANGKNKIAKGEKVGVKVSHIKFPNDVSQKLVIDYINRCNEDKDVHGII